MRYLSSLLSLVALPFASALVMQIPTNPVSGGITDILWTNEVRDPPTWSLFLMDSRDAFGLRAILGEYVDPAPERLTNIQLPIMEPGDYYILKAVNVSNVDMAIAWSPKFSIP